MHKLPTEAAVEAWRGGTPEGFCFAVKLKDPEACPASWSVS